MEDDITEIFKEATREAYERHKETSGAVVLQDNKIIRVFKDSIVVIKDLNDEHTRTRQKTVSNSNRYST